MSDPSNNQDPLAEAKAELLQLEHALTKRLAELDKTDERPGMSTAVGRLTFMDEHQQHQMAQAGRRNAESKLGRVRAALVRVDDGTYGTCTGCGTAIAPERLEYMPETAYCVNCHGRG